VNDSRLNYHKYVVQKGSDEATCRLFYIIRYRKSTIKNEYGIKNEREVEYAKEVYKHIEKQLSAVMEKQ